MGHPEKKNKERKTCKKEQGDPGPCSSGSLDRTRKSWFGEKDFWRSVSGRKKHISSIEWAEPPEKVVGNLPRQTSQGIKQVRTKESEKKKFFWFFHEKKEKTKGPQKGGKRWVGPTKGKSRQKGSKKGPGGGLKSKGKSGDTLKNVRRRKGRETVALFVDT